MRGLIALLDDMRGVAAVEYGLGLALVAIVSITVWGALGSQAAPEPAPLHRAA